MSRIDSYLWLGDAYDSEDRELFQTNNIRTVINCTAEVSNHFQKDTKLQVTYHKLDLEDDPSQSISQVFQKCHEIIAACFQKKEGVLVHCLAGVSRSATVVIAHTMIYKKWCFDKARSLVASKRSIICPNTGFQRQLLSLEKDMIKNKLLAFKDCSTAVAWELRAEASRAQEDEEEEEEEAGEAAGRAGASKQAGDETLPQPKPPTPSSTLWLTTHQKTNHVRSNARSVTQQWRHWLKMSRTWISIAICLNHSGLGGPKKDRKKGGDVRVSYLEEAFNDYPKLIHRHSFASSATEL
eukprot:g64744.t1